MSDQATLVAFVVAIAMSLMGGLLLGYFYGRVQNGYREDIDALRGHIADLDDRLDHLHAMLKQRESPAETKPEPPAAESLAPVNANVGPKP